jgi:hypothetical protein
MNKPPNFGMEQFHEMKIHNVEMDVLWMIYSYLPGNE